MGVGKCTGYHNRWSGNFKLICDTLLTYIYSNTYMPISLHTSLGTIVPNSRDRQGKLWLLKKQKTALKTTLQ